MDIDTPPFYLNAIPEPGCVAEITGSEALHASKSRRLAIGDHMHAMDGKGTIARARIVARFARGDKLKVKIEESNVLSPPQPRIVLASAVAKGERQSILLSMAVQLGMNDYIPLECERSVVRYRSTMDDRWNKIILQSSKQCRQAYLPNIHRAMTLRQLLESNEKSARDGGCVHIVGDRGGEPLTSVDSANFVKAREIFLIIGPEGGLSDSEKQILNAKKILKLRLANYVLRIETAAIALCTAVHQLVISKR